MSPLRSRATFRRATAVGLTVGLGLGVTACSSGSNPDGGSSGSGTLTIYSGQHRDLLDSVAAAFTKKTGIAIQIRDGEDADIANQIIEEGDKTTADLYLSEDPGPASQVAQHHLFLKVPRSDFAQVDQRLVPSSKDWLPYAARSRVIYYNPKKISKSQLPHSIMDLSKPRWKGMFAYAPSGAFVATVSYLINTIGKSKTLSWLKGIKTNGINEQKNGKVRDTVEAGRHAFGLSNHYYWWRLAQTKGGPSHLTSKIYYFPHPDAGGLLMASGAGILKSSTHKAQAKKFLAWLVAPHGGQAIIGGSDADKDGAQFPVAKGVKSKISGLPALSSLHAPDVDQSVFADTDAARELLEQVGIS